MRKAILILLILLLIIPFVSATTCPTFTADGDSYVCTDGSYIIRKWIGAGTYSFDPGTTTKFDYIAVASGGAGGWGAGGAGGAGGLLTGTIYPGAGNLTIKIGEGGYKGTASHPNGYKGGNTNITGTNVSGIEAIGGGPGNGFETAIYNGDGGSAGGGSYNGKAGGTGTAGQGTNGGTGGTGGSGTSGGGGGGYSQAGQSATPTTPANTGGKGGEGYVDTVFGLGNLSGGAAGGSYAAANVSGGSMVGGNSIQRSVGGDGTPNTGSGGAGGSYVSVGLDGGNGSSGVVALRYLSSGSDTTPPDSITGLTNTTALCSEITWQWTNPGGSLNTDYSHLYTLKNDAYIGNYSNSTSAATWAGLTALTSYTFSSKTVDLTGNVNATWVNRTVTTPACPTPTPTPAPTAAPGTQWCGLQSIYFNHGYAILPAGYESLNVTPPGPPEIDENVTVKASTSPKLIDSYISPQGYPGVTSIAAGTRTYNMYGYVGGAAGITRFNVTLHTRDITGLETFHYQAYSDDINDLSVANQQFSFSHPQINMATTDRLVIRVYADTDAASDKVVHWIYQGTTHSSRVDSAYFNCAVPTTATPIPTWQPEINPTTDHKTDPWSLVKEWWWLPVTLAALMIIFGKR